MNEGTLDSIQAARARVAAQVAEAETRNAAVARLADDVSALTVRIASPRGEVTVTASPTGRVVQVSLTSAAETLAAAALSQLVTDTVARAQHSAAMAAVQRSAELLGEHSPFVVQLRDDAESTFPDRGSGAIGYR